MAYYTDHKIIFYIKYSENEIDELCDWLEYYKVKGKESRNLYNRSRRHILVGSNLLIIYMDEITKELFLMTDQFGGEGSLIIEFKHIIKKHPFIQQTVIV